MRSKPSLGRVARLWSCAALAAASLAVGSAGAQGPGVAATSSRPEVDASKAVSITPGEIPAPIGPPASAPPVTVTGRRVRPCANHDRACIDRISAEIWKRYPQQIETLCNRQRIAAMREGFVEEDLGVTGVINDHLTPQTQELCTYGERMRTAAAKAAADAKPAP